jgi:hypothetical protein
MHNQGLQGEMQTVNYIQIINLLLFSKNHIHFFFVIGKFVLYLFYSALSRKHVTFV